MERGNIVCDLDGVLYLAEQSIDGAGAALGRLSDGGFRVLFATNAALLTPQDVADRIADCCGYPAQADQVVTSAMAAASMLLPDDHPVHVIGEAGLVRTLETAGIPVARVAQKARSVVVGLSWDFGYESILSAMRVLERGGRLIATNTDPTYPTPQGVVPGAGVVVAAIETATGRSAEVAGKPHEPMRVAIRGRLGPGRTWVVGDRPETDLAMASCEGWTSVLVLTGVTADAAEAPAELAPDHVIASIAELPELVF
jgi:HAD superfamily hydrolase (TIGR01450 family)